MTFRPRLSRARVRRLARLAVALSVLLALAAGGGWFWLRDSSLVRVSQVEITGVTASDGDRVRSALETAALDQSTLHLKPADLRAAVAGYPSVARLRLHAGFPHKLTIQVVEERPVAALAFAHERVPVTRSGLVLRGLQADRELPSVRLSSRADPGKRVSDRRLLGALVVAGDAPAALLRRTSELALDPRGVIVTLRDGPDLVFGDGQSARAKWTAAARVLADPSAAGATYLDLRIPGRVGAGGLAPVADPTPDPNTQPEGQNGTTLNP
jgi:cell division protein FtsQ